MSPLTHIKTIRRSDGVYADIGKVKWEGERSPYWVSITDPRERIRRGFSSSARTEEDAIAFAEKALALPRPTIELPEMSLALPEEADAKAGR